MEIWRRNLYIVWIAQFTAMMGMSMIVPFLPFFIKELGVVEEVSVARWSGIVFSAPFIVSFFATPFWGTIGDRFGRKLMAETHYEKKGYAIGVLQIATSSGHLLGPLFGGVLADLVGYRYIFN